VPGVSQGIAAGVPQHVREDGEGHTGAPAEALEQADIGPPRSLVNTYGQAFGIVGDAAASALYSTINVREIRFQI
jgi:hypothetical protein